MQLWKRRGLCLLLSLTLVVGLALPGHASGEDYKAYLSQVLHYLKGNTLREHNENQDDLCVGSTGGEWSVLAQARAGTLSDTSRNVYLEDLKDYVVDCEGRLNGGTTKYTEYSRVVLAISALGMDASRFDAYDTFDLVGPLLDMDGGEYRASIQGNNGSAFALIALDSRDYYNTAEGNAARRAFVESLLANQYYGSWSINNRTGGDIDTTAMAVQSLAPYYLSSGKCDALSVSADEVRKAVDSAVNWLSRKFTGDYASSEAAAQVVVALSALKLDADTDARFTANGISVLGSLLDYSVGDGGFAHIKSDFSFDQTATEQAAYALVAYDRFKNGKNSLYDMTPEEEPPAPCTHSRVVTTTEASGAKRETCQDCSRIKWTFTGGKTLLWEPDGNTAASVTGTILETAGNTAYAAYYKDGRMLSAQKIEKNAVTLTAGAVCRVYVVNGSFVPQCPSVAP